MKIFAANSAGKGWLVLAPSEAEAAAMLPSGAKADQVIEVMDRATGQAGILAALSGRFTQDEKILTERPH